MFHKRCSAQERMTQSCIGVKRKTFLYFLRRGVKNVSFLAIEIKIIFYG